MHSAPDGSPVELYRRLPERTTEAELIDSLLAPRSRVLDLGCGTGRLAEPLCRHGHRVVGVDNEPQMLASLQLAAGVAADIQHLDLGREFDAVLMMSHLVNSADHRFVGHVLDTARRHTAPTGLVLVERHVPGWVATCEVGTALVDGIAYTLADIGRRDDVMTATIRYEFDGAVAEQRFSVRDVDDTRMGDLAAAAGLRVTSVLNEAGTLVRLAAAEPK